MRTTNEGKYPIHIFWTISHFLLVHSNLNWFGFETRVRRIVYELLDQPMLKVKSMIDQQEKIDQTLDFNKRRIDEHDFLLYKFQKRTDMESEYEHRITKMEQDVN